MIDTRFLVGVGYVVFVVFAKAIYLRIPSRTHLLGVWLLVVLSIKCSCEKTFLWSSFQGRMVDALASGAEEGRGNLR